MVEYALLVAGIALVGLLGVSMLGRKTSDLIGTVAAVMPGAEPEDNGPIESGALVETTKDSTGTVVVDVPSIIAHSGTSRLGNNLGADVEDLVVEPPPYP